MRHINVRELRATIPRLKEALVAEHELILVNNGEPVARILPLRARPRHVSLADHRSGMAMLPVAIETLIREERDER